MFGGYRWFAYIDSKTDKFEWTWQMSRFLFCFVLSNDIIDDQKDRITVQTVIEYDDGEYWTIAMLKL